MNEDPRSGPARRLQEAREAAGFDSARSAAERFHWKPATYGQHENGTRGISRAAARYADAFRTTQEWLLFGIRPPADPTSPRSSVIPYDLRRDGPRSASSTLLAMARAAGAGEGRDVWRVTNESMVTAGYLPGDFLLLDHRDIHDPEEGSTILIAINDFDLGTAVNQLAHHAPPFAIVLGAGSGQIKAHRIDRETIEIKGVITASWRTYD